MDLIRMLVVVSCASAVAACAAPEGTSRVSAEPAVDETTAVAATGSEPEGQFVDKVVCKRIYRTGTRTNSTRTCATVAEWEELARESKNATDDLSRRTGMQNMEGN